MLYKIVELPSDEPVQFVGVYVLRWGMVDEPTVAFRVATDEEIAAALPKCDCGADMRLVCNGTCGKDE